MAPSASEPEWVASLQGRLRDAPSPLKLADVKKGLPKPKGIAARAWDAEIRAALADAVGMGTAFVAASGKKGEQRWWGRDERHLLREKAVGLAIRPATVPALAKILAAESGADGAFIGAILRDLILEGRLHEHPGTKGPFFGSSPPRQASPLEKPSHAKKLAALIASVQGLAAAAGVADREVLAALSARLAPEEAAAAPASISRAERLILDAVEREWLSSLPDLRRAMPADLRGRVFDEAVLRLRDAGRITLSRDADPLQFTEDVRAEHVRDGGTLFTTIAARS